MDSLLSSEHTANAQETQGWWGKMVPEGNCSCPELHVGTFQNPGVSLGALMLSVKPFERRLLFRGEQCPPWNSNYVPECLCGFLRLWLAELMTLLRAPVQRRKLSQSRLMPNHSDGA